MTRVEGYVPTGTKPESAQDLLVFETTTDTTTQLSNGLLVQASLALGKRLSTHPALRANSDDRW